MTIVIFTRIQQSVIKVYRKLLKDPQVTDILNPSIVDYKLQSLQPINKQNFIVEFLFSSCLTNETFLLKIIKHYNSIIVIVVRFIAILRIILS